MKRVLDPKLAEHLSTYPYAIVSYVDSSGYPVNVATGFRVEADGALICLEPCDAPDRPGIGTEVELTFSHVRPRPGVGYDERRYVNVWGPVVNNRSGLVVSPTRSAGWDERNVPFVEYCERTLPQAQQYMAKLSEERGERVAPYLPLRWRLFLATRVPFLSATLVPVLLGAVVARSQGHSAWWLAALALVGASCIHLGLNVLNDIFDMSSGADQLNLTPTPFSGGSRAVLYGLVTTRWMWTLAVLFFAAGSAIGVWLAITRTTAVLWLGVAGVVLSIAYTAPPLKLVYRGLGDIAVAAGFGPIMTLGSYAVVARQLSFDAFYASLPIAVFVMLILYVNQVPDRRGDARAGKRTVAVRFPKDVIIRGHDAFAILGFALIAIGVVAGTLPIWALFALVAAPIALRVHRGLVKSYDDPFGLVPALGANIAVHLIVGIALIIAYTLRTIL